MTQSAKAAEPSMEEILASIRRIIADDDFQQARRQGQAEPPKPAAAKPAPPRPVPPPAPPPRAAAPPPPPAAEPPPSNNQDDIDAMMAGLDAGPEPAAAEPDEPMESGILDLTEGDGGTRRSRACVPDHRRQSRCDVRRRGARARTAAAAAPVAGARARHGAGPSAHVVLTSAAVDSAFNSLAQTVLVQNARTLEDLVKEMLRPLLKSWLDDNLPGVVDRIVRAEIERVSRGRNTRFLRRRRVVPEL